MLRKPSTASQPLGQEQGQQWRRRRLHGKFFNQLVDRLLVARERCEPLLHVLLGNAVVYPPGGIRPQITYNLLVWGLKKPHSLDIGVDFFRQHACQQSCKMPWRKAVTLGIDHGEPQAEKVWQVRA